MSAAEQTKPAYAEFIEHDTGIPVRPADPMPGIVCWINVSCDSKPHYFLHDPERPDRTRQALGMF